MARNSTSIECGLKVGADANMTHAKSLYFYLIKKRPNCTYILKKDKKALRMEFCHKCGSLLSRKLGYKIWQCYKTIFCMSFLWHS